MKISEHIEHLQRIMNGLGNMEVVASEITVVDTEKIYFSKPGTTTL